MDVSFPPPPAPDDPEPALGPIVVSLVNADIEFIDDLATDDERDELVEQMNVHGNCIQSMDGLEAFTGLVELCLSSNCIEEVSFHALQPLVHLRVLDLISSTLGFPHLPRLEELSMAHNCLQGLDGWTRPIKFPKLRYLDLRGNEITVFNQLASDSRICDFKRLMATKLIQSVTAMAISTPFFSQLEKQIAELKANVESVYNKCIGKDEAIQQLKTSLASRQDELETLRMQHVKDNERQDKLHQQQQDLYERQLQTSIVQVEMEFRKEYQQSTQKFQVMQRKYQERLKDMKRIREAYQVSLQREAAAKAEVEKLQAILQDDKKKLFVEDTKRSDAFKAEILEERSKRKEVEQRLVDEQKKYAQVAVLKAELDERHLENEKLHADIQLLEEHRETCKKLEDDLRAALKVKDVMLADQLRQIKELTNDRQNAEAQFNDEIAEYQTQIEDLEAALDENLQKAAEEVVKNETLSGRLAVLEKDVPMKDDELNSLRSDLEQKVSALEFLDQEMQRMRTVLENQDELFQKRIQKHTEHHREEVERVRVGAEEERERQRHGWETERGEMVHKYEVLATEMEKVAAQNGKLRVALDQERRKTAQNDRDMRILLAQIDRERQSKKENLRQIKSLFEQLQREGS
ncbi:hypothetical protein PHMEG_0001132 [Phytophthora megakarya]|uniref:Uncharacterized protein n=1 Tax=Phytophthora megakarya TaxID=4795 RepID=A0A225X3H4_9STRA|nr:hypothetical protein PHMEG_0001132 [Phytophthora megakarya]